MKINNMRAVEGSSNFFENKQYKNYEMKNSGKLFDWNT